MFIEESNDCSWCGKTLLFCEGAVSAPTGGRYCSDTCFAQSRRASFKRAKICDWCRHIRHTVSQEDYQGATSGLQFCSDKCLNQYKMHVFCRETQTQLEQHPHLRASLEQTASAAAGSKSKEGLITPELWMHDCRDNSLSPSTDETANQTTSPNNHQNQNFEHLIDQHTSPTLFQISDTRGLASLQPVSLTPPEVPRTYNKTRENKRKKFFANNNIPLSDANLRSKTPAPASVISSGVNIMNSTPASSGSSPNSTAHFRSTTPTPYSMRRTATTPTPASSGTNCIPFNNPGSQIPPAHNLKTVRQQHAQRRPQMRPRYGMQQPIVGPPPVTVLVPYPVVMPVPMPIPIPIPLPFAEFVKAYNRQPRMYSVPTTNAEVENLSANATQVGPLDCSVKRNQSNLPNETMPNAFYSNDTTPVNKFNGENQVFNESAKLLQKKARRRRRPIKQPTD
ncbi:sine oculis-binding protein homolog [Ctenocephalides felis]|uniref:sine oculis-binding protein homolog n=1 Tax=Ctenocephalides felis TaxID=7515 RepID=UPI000E6E49D5|nr:sine oculis-binding protein homolog [Ctenocephalides felis]